MSGLWKEGVRRGRAANPDRREPRQVFPRGPEADEQITAHACRSTGRRNSGASAANPAGLTRYDYRSCNAGNLDARAANG